MNCKSFEAIISDLAREQMLEAHTREGALSHVEQCAGCAAMLEEERALTGALRSLSASMKQVEAPAPLEADLLAKFRERRAVESSPVVASMPQRVSTWRRWYPRAAAAAVLLMFAIGGASILRLKHVETPPAQPSTAKAIGSKQAPQAMPASSNPYAPRVGEGGSATIASAQEGAGDKGREPGQKLSPKEVDIIMGATTTTTARRSSPGYQSVPKSRINGSALTQTSSEIATDFMPVSYGDNLNDIDNGRIVRVEMPRSALAQFGLPVNMDRANERIKADVLIGDDGMARAIRFVR